MYKSIASVTIILILTAAPYASADHGLVTENFLQHQNSFSQRLRDSVLPGLNKPKNELYTNAYVQTRHDRSPFETDYERLNSLQFDDGLDPLPVEVLAPNLLRLSF